MKTVAFRRGLRVCVIALGGVTRGSVLASSLFVISAVALIAVVVLTNAHVVLPGVLEIWSEPYENSPSVVFQSNGTGVAMLFAATLAVLVVWQVKSALRREPR